MKKTKLKVGDVLLAKDECVMTSDFKPSLTIGKYYTVKSSVNGQFMVIDDQKCQHFFDTSNLDEYFYIPNKLVAPSANAKPIVLDELGQTEARVLDAPKWGELVEAPKGKKSLTNSKVIKTLKAENEALKSDIFHLEETIRLQEETIKTLTQMATPAPKKEQSIFFDLLEHLNIVKK